MTISYVGGQAGGFLGTLSDQTITFSLSGGSDSTPGAGDLVVVSYAIGVGASSDLSMTIKNATATDYTLAGSELYQAGSGNSRNTNLRVAYRFMPGTPETTCVLSNTTDTSWPGTYTIHVYRGIDTVTPMDVTVTTATGQSTHLANPPSITPVTIGAWIQAIGAGASTTGVAVFTSSDLSGFISNAQIDGKESVIGSGYKSDWTSGAFDPAVFAGGGTDNANDSWAAVTLVLRPAVAGGSGLFPCLIALMGG